MNTDIEAQTSGDHGSQAAGKLSVRIIGLGGAGLHAIQHMADTDLAELTYVAVHTNQRSLAESAISQKLLLGSKRLRGLGAGGDPGLGKAVAEEHIAELKAAAEGADLVFIVAGLGGGTATGAAPVLARAARETGALVLALVTLPFEFEGARRQRQAQLGFHHLKAAADGVICLPHQRLTRLLDENTSLVETFTITNDLLAQAIRGVWEMLSRPGLINVDFADLCSVLRGRHAESYFASAQARGEGRAREVVDQLLANPLLDSGQTLSEAEAILVNLVGGSDLTMADLNRILEQINRHAENARLILGASADPAFTGQIRLTLITSRQCHPAEFEAANGDDETGSESVASELKRQFLDDSEVQRPASRFIPPPPALTPERTEQLWAEQSGRRGRRRKSNSRWKQGQLPLEIVSKGRFEKSEPTIHHGEDLDVPTYIRRGIALN